VNNLQSSNGIMSVRYTVVDIVLDFQVTRIPLSGNVR